MADEAPDSGRLSTLVRGLHSAAAAWRARALSRFARVGAVRVRLTIAVAILSVTSLTAGGVLLVRSVETTVIRAIEAQSLSELRVIRAQIELGMPIEGIQVSGIDRTVTFVRPDGSKRQIPWPGSRRSSGLTDQRQTPWSVVELPVTSPAEGQFNVIAMSPLDDVRRSTETLQQVLRAGVPLLTILLTLAAWILVGRALRPVLSMTQRAATISDASTVDRLTVPPSFDEVAELARTLNGMLDRMAEGALRQREFVSDASHELRSPIAAMRTQLEVSLAHPNRLAHDEVLRGALAETIRLEVLVADLLALARLDEGYTVPPEEVDLDDIVLDEAARVRAVPVDTHGVTGMKVRGERKNLAHLVRNLLDNAARHAVSRVVVSSRFDDGLAFLLVDDDGPGIPEGDRARVFERFTRLSPSRSRDIGGAGLGLAVVRRIAEQHGATVRVDRAPQGGARLEVRFALPRRQLVTRRSDRRTGSS